METNLFLTKRWFMRWFVSTVSIALILGACNFPTKSLDSGSEEESFEGIDLTDKEEIDDFGQIAVPGAHEAGIAGESSGETVTYLCPPCSDPGSATLWFQHEQHVSYGSTELHIEMKKAGLMPLDICEGLAHGGPVEVPLEIKGISGGECPISGKGTIYSSASGTCQNGEVALDIEESWEASIDIFCEDGTIHQDMIPLVAVPPETRIFKLQQPSANITLSQDYGLSSGSFSWTLIVGWGPIPELVPGD
jgi:hypothetical protein